MNGDQSAFSLTAKENLHSISLCHISKRNSRKIESLKPAPWFYRHSECTQTYTELQTVARLCTCSVVSWSDTEAYLVCGLTNGMSFSLSRRGRKRISRFCGQEMELTEKRFLNTWMY